MYYLCNNTKHCPQSRKNKAKKLSHNNAWIEWIIWVLTILQPTLSMRLATDEKEFMLFFEEFKNKFKNTKSGDYFLTHYGLDSSYKYCIMSINAFVFYCIDHLIFKVELALNIEVDGKLWMFIYLNLFQKGKFNQTQFTNLWLYTIQSISYNLQVE